MEIANPLLESFGEPPKACVTNSNSPPANLKGKGNPDMPQVCSNYWPPNVAQFVFLPLVTLVLFAMQVCNIATVI